MIIEKHITLFSGETLDIPDKLYEVIVAEELSHQTTLELESPENYLEMILNFPEERFPEGTRLALQVASYLQGDQRNYDESMLYLCLYADRKTQILWGSGQQDKALEILSDILELEKNAFSSVKPLIARKLADLMIGQSEQVIKICSLSGSIQVLASRITDLVRALDIARTFWDPELASIIHRINKETEDPLRNLGAGFSQDDARRLHQAVNLLKREFQTQISHKPATHRDTLKKLVDAFSEMIQQEIMVASHTTYTSQGLNSEIIYRQAKDLIEKVEKRLRLVIEKKYQQQFGTSWVQHISAKFRPMYERWQRYMQKDQSAFKLYNDYSPELLDYALMEDLKDLIVSQWHLFRDVFDFGYQDRNRAVFLDKIFQIISVRNALAHHRMPPENELLRARVLCTDILLALDRSGETSE
jgi:hypothetical protein